MSLKAKMITTWLVLHTALSLLINVIFEKPSGYHARPAGNYQFFLGQNNKIRKAVA